MTAGGAGQPRRSSAAVKTRPSTGATPSVVKKSPLTHSPCAARLSPPALSSKFGVSQAKAFENASCRSRMRSHKTLVLIAWSSIQPERPSPPAILISASVRRVDGRVTQPKRVNQPEDGGVRADAERGDASRRLRSRVQPQEARRSADPARWSRAADGVHADLFANRGDVAERRARAHHVSSSRAMFSSVSMARCASSSWPVRRPSHFDGRSAQRRGVRLPFSATRRSARAATRARRPISEHATT